MLIYNPVPFDFVPFADQKPVLKKAEAWEEEGVMLSGRIDYTITVLTPVHVVGRQKNVKGYEHVKIEKSFFHREGGLPLIPGSSLKGMLRTFFEALTNSWVGEATKEFTAKGGELYMGYKALGQTQKGGSKDAPAIPLDFQLPNTNNGLDLASFLFGTVLEGESDGNANKSRLTFEDICLDENLVTNEPIYLPDIPSQAFMGGPKPRKNNWWYFKPFSVKRRIVINNQGDSVETASFIGSHYWGRKFYYHQKPQRALGWYGNKKNWPQKLYTYPAEIVPTGVELKGCIYYEQVPSKLLELFIYAIQPGHKIKHKLGYAKAFGLGSIGMKVDKIKAETTYIFEEKKPELSLDFTGGKVPDYVHKPSLVWLRRILQYDDLVKNQEVLFVYPPFKGGFGVPLSWYKVQNAWPELRGKNSMELNETDAKKLALKLFEKKRTIHFRLYQEKAQKWERISSRA